MRLKTQAVSAYRQQSAVFHHSVDVAYQRPFGLILLIKLHIIPTLEHLHVHSENLLTSTLTVISRGNGLEAIPTRMRGNVSKLFRCSLNFSFLQNSPKSSMFNKRNSSQMTGTHHLCLKNNSKENRSSISPLTVKQLCPDQGPVFWPCWM